MMEFVAGRNIAPVPVVASAYLTRTQGRVSTTPGRYRSEEKVRSRAVRRRLDDPAFVDASIRTLADGSTPISPGDTEPSDGDFAAQLQILRNIARRREHGIRILEWAPGSVREQLRHLLRYEALETTWLVLRHVGAAPVSLVDSDVGRVIFDAAAAQPSDIVETMSDSSVTEIRFRGDLCVEGLQSGSLPGAEYATLPVELGSRFDVILVGGPMPGACLQAARELIESDGLVLLESDGPLPELGAGEFASWRAIGDGFWVGSVTETGFTDVVPIRSLLRGLTRPEKGRAPTTPLDAPVGP